MLNFNRFVEHIFSSGCSLIASWEMAALSDRDGFLTQNRDTLTTSVREFLLMNSSSTLGVSSDLAAAARYVSQELPFRVCYFALSHPLVLHYTQEQAAALGIETVVFYSLLVTHEHSDGRLVGIACVDFTGPSIDPAFSGKILTVLSDLEPDSKLMSNPKTDSGYPSICGAFLQMAEYCVRQLRENYVSVEAQPTRRIHPRGHAKIKLAPSQLVRVGAKTRAASRALPGGLDIEWTHSWEVMGHWRKTRGMGHGRDGQIIFEGRTWVSPYKKGKGALVKKTRVLTSSAQSH